jgi:GNAT superfamily N-acetyltransferase
MEITELQTEEEYREVFPLMKQLRSYLTEDDFIRITGEMVWDGYRLFAVREGAETVALAGVAVRLNLGYGRHLWVYELVTKEDRRSEGLGKQLLDWLEDLARQEGCERIALSSNVRRKDAHRFYEEKAGYELRSYLYSKAL